MGPVLLEDYLGCPESAVNPFKVSFFDICQSNGIFHVLPWKQGGSVRDLNLGGETFPCKVTLDFFKSLKISSRAMCGVCCFLLRSF